MMNSNDNKCYLEFFCRVLNIILDICKKLVQNNMQILFFFKLIYVMKFAVFVRKLIHLILVQKNNSIMSKTAFRAFLFAIWYKFHMRFKSVAFQKNSHGIQYV